MIILWLSLILSAQTYSGVDLQKIENINASVYQSFETGWMGTTTDGVIRVYVGTSEQDVQEWVELLQKWMYKYSFSPIDNLGDEAFGDQKTLIVVRHGNVGLLAQGKNVSAWITVLQSNLLPERFRFPLPPKPQNLPTGEMQLLVPENQSYSFIGGEPLYANGGVTFRVLPEQVVVWDEYGLGTAWALAQDNRSYIPTEKSLGIQPK